ncbi:MAG: inositol phosphorylceramide synthase [Deltaproteobacteria bacterium]|nr:inositol phosphorylceramide synthase [Deltaproteobacteria bacterium]
MARVSRLLSRLGPDGVVTAVMVVGVAVLVHAVGGQLHFDRELLSPLVLLVALLAITAAWRAPLLLGRRPGDRRRYRELLAKTARTWTPFMLLYACYCVLHRLTGLIVAGGVEAELKALDEALLGTSPAWWLERFITPWLTDVMAFGYGLMFGLPLAALVLLELRGRSQAFRELALAILVAFYAGFVLYLLVPARSPRLVYGFATELEGAIGLYESWTLAWDRLQQTSYDAFPSLHTTISTIALVAAWRHGSALSPRWPWLWVAAFLPAVVLLQLATLYLRQHYFVDLVAGWLLAGFALWLAPRIIGWWERAAAAGATFAPPAEARLAGRPQLPAGQARAGCSTQSN